VKLTTRPEDEIYVWGRSHRSIWNGSSAPTRYFYVYPLYTRGYQSADHVSELLAALIEDPPMVIVDASAAAIEVVPPLDRQERSLWTATDNAYAGCRRWSKSLLLSTRTISKRCDSARVRGRFTDTANWH